MTIFTRQKAFTPMGKSNCFDKSTVVMIEHSWKHVLAIARNQMDQLHLDMDIDSTSAPFYQHQSSSFSSTNSEDSHTRAQHRILSEHQSQQYHGFYDRERLMIQALDTLFSVAGEGSGYIVFLATMIQLLDPDCPVSMAFLSHVVDRATLPSKTTLTQVAPALLSIIGFKYTYNNNSVSSTTEATMDDDNNKNRWNFWTTHHHFISTAPQPKQQPLVCEFGSQVDGRMKRNLLVILGILAEKFAGEMVHLLWTPDISVILFYFLASNDETWTVRVFALLVLEKFALTGDIKFDILQNPLHIQNTLRKAIEDSKFGKLDNNNSSSSSINNNDDDDYDYEMNEWNNIQTTTATENRTDGDPTNRTGITAIFNTLRNRHERSCVDWISTCMQKLSKRKATLHYDDDPVKQKTAITDPSFIYHHLHQQCHQQHINTEFMDTDKVDRDEDEDDCGGSGGGGDDNFSNDNDSISRYGLTEQEDQEDATKNRGYSFDSSYKDERSGNQNNSSDGGFSKSLMRLENSPQNGIMRRMELALCAEWSLGHIFNDPEDKCGPSTWNLSGLNVIVNPFDATQHWKIGTNGLEIRNDRLYFESIRATACVKKGRWYYEVLLVTEGIMQIGWCTNRCRFVPEDGYGVGDDQHGFAFDTYRSAVWANGSVVYHQQHNSQYKCRAGDVLGSYLDMDQGICSFYVNGKDVGSTVAFEHASSSSTNHDDDDGRTGMEGLYPAFSLTAHQHIIINFGDQPWMYLPENLVLASGTTYGWKGINQADLMTRAFYRQLKNGINNCLDDDDDDKRESNERRATTETSTTSSSPQSISKHEDDWDGPLCTMCFNEPKDTNLIPCGHGRWGATCTKILVSCPLCRSKIEGFTKCVEQE